MTRTMAGTNNPDDKRDALSSPANNNSADAAGAPSPASAPDPAPAPDPARSGTSRRTFLAGTGGVALGLAAGWGARHYSHPARNPSALGARNHGDGSLGQNVIDFRGENQAGIDTIPQAHGTFIAFDLKPGADIETLRRLMAIWTQDAERLTAGIGGLTDTEKELAFIPASLTLTLGLGPGFFKVKDIADKKPAWLNQLPPYPQIDKLEDRWSGGDIVWQVCADDPLTVGHAVRILARETRAYTTVRWVQHGFRNSPGAIPAGQTMRNLFGQLDGSHNPNVVERPEVIFRNDPADPDWLHGGSTLVIRRIRMHMDTWDEVDRVDRSAAIGRHIDDGTPLTGGDEFDDIDFDAVGPLGFPVIDPAAHARRARTDDPTQVIHRRVYNYDVAPEGAELSNVGLIFSTYQADIDHQYKPLQERLAKMDLMNIWTTPIGSAVFAIPGGLREGEHYLLERLIG